MISRRRQASNHGGFWLAFLSLTAAFALAVVALQPPAPQPATAPATDFSAARAMIDIHQIAQRPHPAGSPEHLLVERYLLGRLRALGLSPILQEGVLAAGPKGRPVLVRNFAGVLPGRDHSRTVLIMAHYDTTAISPGAADDATGVAAALEAIRAIKARGTPERDVIVLFTDAEEDGLLGSRLFFATHPYAPRIGAVVNLEARGGGGRALMFETGPGNAETVNLFAKAAGKAAGGPSSNSLAVFVYRQMPNGSDFTRAVERGLPGVNIAFLGRPGQYHTPRDTPDRLDQRSVQHLGSQALEMADAFARARALPKSDDNLVYGDVLGRVILRHPPAVGWALLGIAGLLMGAAAWRARKANALPLTDIGKGALDGIWFILAGSVLISAAMAILRPTGKGQALYYALLERLYILEAATVAVVVVLGVALLAGRRRLPRWLAAGGLGLAVLGAALVQFNGMLLVAGLIAIALTLAPRTASMTGLGGSLGAAALVLPFAILAQALAPEAALVLIWPLFATAIAVFWMGFVDGKARMAAPVVLGIVTAAWLIGQGHFLFLGVGADFPAALLVVGLLALMALRPLAANHERLDRS